MQVEIEFCYDNGNLERALLDAATEVRRIGEHNVLHVIAHQDENIPGAWWVDVIHKPLGTR